jgi:hypothetical protein
MMFYYPFRKLPLASGAGDGREEGLVLGRKEGGLKGRRVMVSQWTVIGRVEIMSIRRESAPFGCGMVIPSMLYKLFHQIEYSPY